jgi:hypothetical protein
MTTERALVDAAISDIGAMAMECSAPGWDGEAAEPISTVAVVRGTKLVRALPDGFELPEFAPEPDGSISLDWIQSRNRLFSVSVGASDRLAYAWLDGTDRGHGVTGFDGDRVPPVILGLISGITG